MKIAWPCGTLKGSWEPPEVPGPSLKTSFTDHPKCSEANRKASKPRLGASRRVSCWKSQLGWVLKDKRMWLRKRREGTERSWEKHPWKMKSNREQLILRTVSGWAWLMLWRQRENQKWGTYTTLWRLDFILRAMGVVSGVLKRKRELD